MSLLSNTLSNNSFYITNKKLIKALGPIAAMVLTHLIDQHKYLEEKDELQSDGSFFCYREWLMENLNIGTRPLDKAIKLIEKLELVFSYRKGIPYKKYFILNEINILAIIDGKKPMITKPRKTQTIETAKRKVYKVRNADINKNKENKNKTKQKPIPSGVLELDLIPEFIKEPSVPEDSEQSVFTIPETVSLEDINKLLPEIGEL